MDDQFQDLQRLLRLKRFEVPPPGHEDDFMREFHRRQRAELLRRPLWRLALDRLEAAIPTFSPVRYAYTGACATAVVAATLVSARILTAPTVNGGNTPTPPGPGPIVQTRAPINIYSAKPSSLRLSPDLNFDDGNRVTKSAAANRTRYVLDASPIQPVVYEQRSDF